MPGSSFPSRNSREAPPPVEIWVILSARPRRCTAATLSPPPTMVTPGHFRVGLAKGAAAAAALSRLVKKAAALQEQSDLTI